MNRPKATCSIVCVQVMLPSLCHTRPGRTAEEVCPSPTSCKFTFAQGQSCDTGVAFGPWGVRSLRVLLQPTSLEQIPHLSCQLFCYCKLPSTSFLTAWLLVSSKIGLFSHQSSAVRPCHMPAPLGAGCQAATRVSKDSQTHRKPGLPCFFKTCCWPFPSPLQDQQSQSYHYEIHRTIPYLLLTTEFTKNSLTFLSTFTEASETSVPQSDLIKRLKNYQQDTVLERVQIFFPSCILVPPC